MKSALDALLPGRLNGPLVRAAGAGIAIRILAVLASLLSSVALARMLGPQNFGTYAFVLALVALLALPVQMGLPTLIVRETAKAVTLRDWALLRGIWSWSTKLILIGSSCIVAIVILGLMAFPEVLAPDRHEALLWGIWLVPLLALAAAREAALRGLKAIFFSGLPDQVLRPIILAALALVAGLLVKDTLTARLTLQLGLIAAATSFLIGAALLLRVRPDEAFGSGQATVKQAEWLKIIVPFSLIAGLQIVRENTDIVMLGIWHGDADVGVYRIALSIATLGVFGLVALYLVAQPYIVSAFTAGDRRALQRIVRGIATLSVLSSLLVATAIWLEGGRIIQLLYGSAYEGAFLPLAILTAGSVAHAVFGMGGGVLSMTGHETSLLWASAAAVALNVVGNAVLIPGYGTAGAATATAASLAIGEVLKYALAFRRMGIDASIFAWIRKESSEKRLQ